MRHGAIARAVLWPPLLRTGRALRELPFVAEETLEKAHAPLRGRGGPGDFEAAGDRVAAFAGAELIAPAEALLLQHRSLRITAHVFRRPRAVSLAERVAACDERDR